MRSELLHDINIIHKLLGITKFPMRKFSYERQVTLLLNARNTKVDLSNLLFDAILSQHHDILEEQKLTIIIIQVKTCPSF